MQPIYNNGSDTIENTIKLRGRKLTIKREKNHSAVYIEQAKHSEILLKLLWRKNIFTLLNFEFIVKQKKTNFTDRYQKKNELNIIVHRYVLVFSIFKLY